MTSILTRYSTILSFSTDTLDSKTRMPVIPLRVFDARLKPCWMASSKPLVEPAITSLTLATLVSAILLTSFPRFPLIAFCISPLRGAISYYIPEARFVKDQCTVSSRASLFYYLTANDKKRYSYCEYIYYKDIEAVIDVRTSSTACNLRYFDKKEET